MSGKGWMPVSFCTMQVFMGKQEQGLVLGLSRFHAATELTEMLCTNIS